MVVGCELKALCEDGEVRYEEAPPCGKNAHCQDGWTCRCDKGYTGDGRQCEAGFLSFFLSFSLRSPIGGVAYVTVSISSATWAVSEGWTTPKPVVTDSDVLLACGR